MKKVQGYSNFYKSANGAIVNTDMNSYYEAKKRKLEKEKISVLENRLDRIEELLIKYLGKENE
jgi:hypothetical protein